MTNALDDLRRLDVVMGLYSPLLIYIHSPETRSQSFMVFNGAYLAATGNVKPPKVFVAAIEHRVPSKKVKVMAGGLGKVITIMQEYHPGD